MAELLSNLFQGIAEVSAFNMASGLMWGEEDMPECLKKKAEAEDDE